MLLKTRESKFQLCKTLALGIYITIQSLQRGVVRKVTKECHLMYKQRKYEEIEKIEKMFKR